MRRSRFWVILSEMAPLIAALFLCASFALGEDMPVQTSLNGTAALSQAAAGAFDAGQAKDAADAAFNGGTTNGDSIPDGTNSIKKGIPLTAATIGQSPGEDVPTPPSEEEKPKRLSSGLMLAGAAALGGLQGWFTAGAIGLAAGAGMGLAAAWLFHEKDYGGAFGVTAGAIVGAVFGGPIGSLIGAAVGGLVGHFLGKFLL